MSISFRWLGVAGLAIRANSEVLAIDPFFTRPSILDLLRPLKTNLILVKQYLPVCNYLLVTHSHYDHLMDVPEAARQSGTQVYGSSNTCQVLDNQGIPRQQFHEVRVGENISLGQFTVEVVKGWHSPLPLQMDHIFNGSLKSRSMPPRYAWDYKMDISLGYRITFQGIRLLVCAAVPQPADFLFVVALESREYYEKMLMGVQPRILVPIHWDNFTHPLAHPLREFHIPGRLSLDQLSEMAKQVVPGCQVIVPGLFADITMG